MLDWLIIGGGVHGTHIAAVLLGRLGVALAVIDPHARQLAAWDRCARSVGMEYLRSPGVHHLGLDPMDLIEWADARPGWAASDPFMRRYLRPSVALFAAHTDVVCAATGLSARWTVGTARRIRRRRRCWRVETTAGRIDARHVVLALGSTARPNRPGWAEALGPAHVSHVFEPGFSRESLAPWRHLVVVGGGISAAQVALSLAASDRGQVTLMMRHRVRRRMFDSDPAWLGPTGMAEFPEDPDLRSRRRVIVESRNRGSMPPEIADRLRTAVRSRVLALRRDEVTAARERAGCVVLDLRGGQAMVCDRIVLATGVDPARPPGR